MYLTKFLSNFSKNGWEMVGICVVSVWLIKE